ncbi:hypothetical protein [Oceanobacillus sp. CAU 1775]
MKQFFGIFVLSIMLWGTFVFFFLGLLIQTMWGLVLIPAFVMAVLIKFLVEQDSRINNLEDKIIELANEAEN